MKRYSMRGSSLALTFSIIGVLNAQFYFELLPTKDAVIGFHEGYPTANNNFGNADHFSCTSQPGNLGGENASSSLMGFDLSTISETSIVDSARLDLYGRGPIGTGASTSVGNGGANACVLERIITPWTEDGVTWNSQPTMSPVNSVLIPQTSTPILDVLDLDVTELVQDMIVAPANSHGFSLRLLVEEPTCGMYFCSSDFDDPSKRPVLRIYLKNSISIAEHSTVGGEFILVPTLADEGRPIQLAMARPILGATVRIMDQAGRLVSSAALNGATFTIETQNLAPGPYSVMVTPKNGLSARHARFVVGSAEH